MNEQPESTRRVRLAGWLQTSVFLLTFNPITTLDAPVKFTAIGTVTAAAVMLLYNPYRHMPARIPKQYLAFAVVLAVAAARTHPVFNADNDNVTLINQTQAALTISVLLSSFYVARRTGTDHYLRCLRWWATVGAVWFAVAVRLDIDRLDLVDVGDFGFGSYQQIGTLIGVAFLLNLAAPKVWWRWVLLVVFGWLLYTNRARGETVAVIVAAGAWRFPKTCGIAGTLAVFFPRIAVGLGASTGSAGLVRLSNGIEVGNFGRRDQLLTEAAGLAADPATLIWGRGTNWFQHTQGYSFGFYPHNQYIEALLVSGVAGAVVFASCWLWPAVKGYTVRAAGGEVPAAAFSVAVYFALLVAKSGTITVNWTLALAAPIIATVTAAVTPVPQKPLVGQTA